MNHIIWVITWVMIYLSQWSSKRNYKTYRGQWRTSKWIPWNTKDFYGYWFFQLTYVLFFLCVLFVHSYCTCILYMNFEHVFCTYICPFSLYIQFVHAFVHSVCICILYMYFEHELWTCILYMQVVHAFCTCELYMYVVHVVCQFL